MKIVTKQLEGRDHLVVPTVILVHGVHNGSGGPVYYPPDSLAQSVQLWNARPVVVMHPDIYADGGAAGNPSVFNRQKIGVLFNTRFEANALKTEAWLDVERTQRVDARVLDAVRNRKMMEVSTGLIFSTDQVPGVWNGKEYSMLARNLVPDHLAILPDLRGACSIADGCGLLVRNNDGLVSDVLLCPEWDFS
jgi:hypothetical protein